MVLLSMKRHLTALRALRLAEATDGVRKWGEKRNGWLTSSPGRPLASALGRYRSQLELCYAKLFDEQAIASGTEVTSDPTRVKSILSSNLRGMFSHTQDTHHASLSSEW
jgi:hypothetical protein